MTEYHKIQTVYDRNPDTKFKTVIEGQWALPEFEYLAQNAWVFTEKVDGTNIRIFRGPDGELLVRGKTDNASVPTFLMEHIRRTVDPANLGDEGLTLYGEGYGARIQKGGGNYKPDGVSFVLFDCYCGMWLERPSVEDIAASVGLDIVPLIGQGTLHDMVERVKTGIVSKWGNFPAEGIVARPVVEMSNRRGHRIITKLKTRDFQSPVAKERGL